MDGKKVVGLVENIPPRRVVHAHNKQPTFSSNFEKKTRLKQNNNANAFCGRRRQLCLLAILAIFAAIFAAIFGITCANWHAKLLAIAYPRFEITLILRSQKIQYFGWWTWKTLHLGKSIRLSRSPHEISFEISGRTWCYSSKIPLASHPLVLPKETKQFSPTWPP